MNEPWGFSGPEFAWLYAGLVIVPMLAGLLLARWGRRYSPDSVQGRLPTIYHFAYLSGGPDRVTDTVVASMMEREQLRVSSSGKLYVTPQQPVDPMQAEVATRLAGLPSTAFSLYEPMRDSVPMHEVAAELARRKLVYPDRGRRRIWRVVFWVYAAVAVLGFVRALTGEQLGYPIGYLVGLMVLAAMGAYVSAWFARPRPQDQNTGAARGVYAENKGDRSLVHGAAGIVAKRGLLRYPDYEVSKALTKEHTAHNRQVAQRKRRRSAVGYASGGGYVGGGYVGGFVCSSGTNGHSCGGGSSCGGGGCGGGGGG
jgi:uncharacterized protein (TIGR04222 family)